jgi:urea carboxylase-associated protein 1
MRAMPQRGDFMAEPHSPPGAIVLDEIVPPGRPWGHRVAKGEMLRLVDLEGQQAVDLLCYDADDPTDRYSATNTVKVQGKLFVDEGTVLYSDLGKALFTIVADTCGKHDTIYGCCSEPNNFLRYGVRDTHSCYANFTEVLAGFGLDRTYIVANVNFFMSVPIAGDGAAVNVDGHSQPGNYVDLRAERDVLAVLSNCPQMHNPCNGYNLTPIRAIIWRPAG